MGVLEGQETFAREEGFLDGCRKDGQTVTADWTPLMDLLHGVSVREVRNVPKRDGLLTEVFRREWAGAAAHVDQVFQVRLEPGGISAWHTHRHTTDRLFVTAGLMRIVLYDARSVSPTHGRLNELRFGLTRPALVVIPPGVWHGLENLSSSPSIVLNLVDRAYDYEDPDHWRLPFDTDRIPFRFARGK